MCFLEMTTLIQVLHLESTSKAMDDPEVVARLFRHFLGGWIWKINELIFIKSLRFVAAHTDLLFLLPRQKIAYGRM